MMEGKLITNSEKTCKECSACHRIEYTDNDYYTKACYYCYGVREPFTIPIKDLDKPCKAYPGKRAETEKTFKTTEEFISVLTDEEKQELKSALCSDNTVGNVVISLDRFKQIIDFLRGGRDFETKLNKMFTDEFGDSIFYPYEKPTNVILSLLTTLFGGSDKVSEELDNYVFTYDFGRAKEVPTEMLSQDTFYQHLRNLAS